MISPSRHPATSLRLWLLFFTTTISLSLSTGQLVKGRLITSIYSWEKFDTVGVSNTYTRGLQSILLDITQSDFSLHTHLQAASLLQDKIDELPDFRAYYLYAQWKNIADLADLSLGRIPFFAGVGNGTVDGARVIFRFAENAYRVTAYGGASVPTDLALTGWKPMKRNFIGGGQILTTALANTRVGISYIARSREQSPYWTQRTDDLSNLVTTYVMPELRKEQYASADLSYQFTGGHAYGRYDYDLGFERTLRGQVGARFDVSDDFSLSGEFIHRAPRTPFNSFFAVFSTSSTDEVEGGVDFIATPGIRAFGRGAYVKYDGENSFRYTLGAACTYVNLSYQGNSGFAGELSNISLEGVYPLCENMITPSIGFSYSSYKLNSSASRQSAYAGALGATLRPLDWLSLDLQGQILRNEIFKSDFRFFGKLNIWFSERFSIFGEKQP